MKRILSILLVMLMLFSLTALMACGGEEDADPGTTAPGTSVPGTTDPGPAEPDDGEVTEEMLKSSKPNEYMREKAAAGMAPTIAFAAPTLASDVMIAMDTGFKRQFEAAGFGYTSLAFDADTTKLVEQMENYGTMGVSIIIAVLFDAGASDIIATLAEMGTSTISWAYTPEFPVAMAIVTNENRLGELAAEMALAWVASRHPGAADGEIHAALLKNDMNTTYIVRFEKVKETLEAGGVSVTFEESNKSMAVDTGYTFAESALLSDPAIRVFVAMTSSEVTGINNYITSLDYSDEELRGYGAFSCDNDNVFRQIIDDAGAGGRSVARGLVSSGSDDPSDFVCQSVFDLIDGKIVPGTIVNAPLYSYNSVGFDYDER